jgi:sortase A
VSDFALSSSLARSAPDLDPSPSRARTANDGEDVLGDGSDPDANPSPLILASKITTALGLLLVAFLVYELLVSALPQHRAQDVLLREFQSTLAEQNLKATFSESGAASGVIGGGAGTGAGDGSGDATTETTEAPSRDFEAAPPMPDSGAAVALLEIPSIGVRQVVVEGTTISQLRNGPGHHRNTVMPGQPGNAAISAPRVANGAPFRDLDRLHEGDEISVTTTQGQFTYVVRSVEEIGSGDPDPLRPTRANQLTLMTSAPPYRASHPLIARAELQGRPVAAPAGTRPLATTKSENGFTTQPGAWANAILAFLALLVGFLGARWLYRRWQTASAWIITTPILLALLFVFCQQAAGLLPATF